MKVLVEEKSLQDIATAIRAKNGTEETYKPSEMASAIDAIEAGGGDNELWNVVSNNGTRGDYLFYNCADITEVKGLENLQPTSANYMFNGCTNLTDVTGLDCSKITSASYMFNGCTSLLSPLSLDFSEPVSANYMFQGCTGITELPNIDFTKITSANYMFNKSGLKSVGELYLPNATNIAYMFCNCNITQGDIIINAPNATNVDYIATNAYGWFKGNLRMIVPKATKVSRLIYNSGAKSVYVEISAACTNLNTLISKGSGCETVEIVGPTAQVKDWNGTFEACPKLTTIIGDLEFVGAGTTQYTFNASPNIRDFTPKRIAKSFQINQVTGLSLESAKAIIAALDDYSGTENEYAYTVTFSATTWSYLDTEGETASPNGNSWREYINDLGWNAS